MKGPPLMRVSHVYLKPGKRDEHHELFAAVAESMKKNCPGVITMLKANDSEDPNLVHIYYVAANSQIHEEYTAVMMNPLKNPHMTKQMKMYTLMDATK